MSIIVFQNHNIVAIKALLIEVGQSHYKAALKEQGLDSQPPITMKGFYLEFETHTKDVKLYHKYPSNTIFFIMDVLGYWKIPKEGWTMIRKEVHLPASHVK